MHKTILEHMKGMDMKPVRDGDVWDITHERPFAADMARQLIRANGRQIYEHVENSPDRAAWIICRALSKGYEPLLSTEASPSEGRRNLVISGYPDAPMEYALWKSTDANAFVSLRHAIHNAMSGKGSLERVMEYVAQKREALEGFGVGGL